MELQSASGAGDAKGNTVSIGPGPCSSSCPYLQEELGLKWPHVLDPGRAEVKKMGLMCLLQ